MIQHPGGNQYKYCHKKFSSSLLAAQLEEMLSEPCTINFERMPVTGLFGFMVNHFVCLNGIKVNIVKNGKTLTFQTIIKNNTLFVTDPYGFAFDCDYNFEAHPGGSIEIKFYGKCFFL